MPSEGIIFSLSQDYHSHAWVAWTNWNQLSEAAPMFNLILESIWWQKQINMEYIVRIMHMVQAWLCIDVIWYSLVLTHQPLGGCGCNLQLLISKLISRKVILSIFCEIFLRWMTQDPTADKSTLVQALAWHHQPVSHWLIQCWSSNMIPYGKTRPPWVNHVIQGYFSGTTTGMQKGCSSKIQSTVMDTFNSHMIFNKI